MEVIAEAEETEVIAETKAPVVETFVALEKFSKKMKQLNKRVNSYMLLRLMNKRRKMFKALRMF